ncbi:MAG: acylphosphatase [Bdellovibrionales bacterium]|nr:acylphosphatase [Bdellovibrionales bacterium]
MAITQVRLLISGRVQGVFYRQSAKRSAESLNLQGFVRNLPNGCVELIAQGEKEQLQAMIQWCQQGPPMASVEKVDLQWIDEQQHFQTFEILDTPI